MIWPYIDIVDITGRDGIFMAEYSTNTISGERPGSPSQNLGMNLFGYSICLDSPEVFKYLPFSAARNQSVQSSVFDS